MEPNKRWSLKQRSLRTTICSLDSNLLSMIFASLDIFDLVRCSSVCKFWHNVIHTSNSLKVQYCKQEQDFPGLSDVSSSSGASLKLYLEEFAIKQHRLSLQNGSVCIDQWNGHFVRVDQCRMKMGFILSGVGDKVMRIWSLGSYKCLEEYPVPDIAPLADFDFDENKIVGLLGTHLCIWRRHGKQSIFSSCEGTFSRGLCMRYIDPEAVVGCEDGAARVFDMYSKKCSQIIRMHAVPITCLALTEDQLILSGSSLGSIKVASLLSDKPVALLKSFGSTGIRSLCFNPGSYLVFAGSTAGFMHCWDLRIMKPLWEKRISPNVIYSVQHLRNDTSSLVVGGIDGVLRILNQNSGELLSSYVIDDEHTVGAVSSSKNKNSYNGVIEKKKARRLSEDNVIDKIPRSLRPPISCLAVGMNKVVTTHNSKFIRLWKFNK